MKVMSPRVEKGKISIDNLVCRLLRDIVDVTTRRKYRVLLVGNDRREQRL